MQKCCDLTIEERQPFRNHRSSRSGGMERKLVADFISKDKHANHASKFLFLVTVLVSDEC